MRFLICIIMVITSSCGLLTSDDEEYSPEIVFSAEDKKGTSQIYTMNEDGSNVTKLTNWEEDSIQPSWSPDGKHILFSTFRQSSSIGPGLWVMDTDGGNKEPLYFPSTATNPMEGNNAQWSPDGKKVIFDICLNCQGVTNYDIILFNLETKEIKKLAESEINETNPVWSPNGERIVFVSDRDYVDADTLRYRKDLYVMNSDGSNVKRVTETGYAKEPVWHPEEDSIVYRSTGVNPGLYKISLQDSNITVIKEDPAEKLHLHPQNWFEKGNKLLITVRALSSSYNNSVMIYDLTNKQEQTIYSGAPINRADWIIQDK